MEYLRFKSLFRPRTKKVQGRKVWSLDLETFWIPVFTASNTIGETNIPSDALGAPLRLAVDDDLVGHIHQRGSNVVRLYWGPGALRLSAREAETGTVESTVPCTVEGGEGRIAFNLRNLLDYLQDKDGFITIGVSNPSSPGQFTYGNGPLVLMMPMFVQWDESVAPKETHAEK
jgi:hypothetical protein